MSDHPYTDEQYEVFRAAAGRHVLLDREDVRLILRGLHDAGIALTFPEPRYKVVVTSNHAHVFDSEDRGLFPDALIAGFNLHRHPDARCAARAEADRLNREVTA